MHELGIEERKEETNEGIAEKDVLLVPSSCADSTGRLGESRRLLWVAGETRLNAATAVTVPNTSEMSGRMS